jgi:tRNA 2-thiouridine synthesizing protein A
MGIFDFLFKKKAQAPVAAPSDPNLETSASSGPVLDCQQMRCPMPIVKIAEAFRGMNTADELTVLATDPAFRADLDAWVRKTGNQLVEFQDGVVKQAILRKAT